MHASSTIPRSHQRTDDTLPVALGTLGEVCRDLTLSENVARSKQNDPVTEPPIASVRSSR